MLAVLTIDQRNSRRALINRAQEWATDLNRRFGDELVLPFDVTLGDEIQGVTATPNAIVEILLEGVREKAWWMGIGIGQVESPLSRTSARSRGSAFYNARSAVEAAKRTRHGFVVRTEIDRLSSDVQAVLELLAFLIRRRGREPARWQAVELARAGRSTVEIGRALGITQQAASKRLLNAGFYEEVKGRELAESLLGEALGRRNAR